MNARTISLAGAAAAALFGVVLLAGGGEQAGPGELTRDVGEGARAAPPELRQRFDPVEALDLTVTGRRAPALLDGKGVGRGRERGRRRWSLRSVRVELFDRDGVPWPSSREAGSGAQRERGLPASFAGPPHVGATLLRGTSPGHWDRKARGTELRTCVVHRDSAWGAIVPAYPGSELAIRVRGGEAERGWFTDAPRRVAVTEGAAPVLRFNASAEPPELALVTVELVAPGAASSPGARPETLRGAAAGPRGLLPAFSHPPEHHDRVLLADPVTREPLYRSPAMGQLRHEFTVPEGEYLAFVEHDPRGPAGAGWGSAMVDAAAGRPNHVTVHLDPGVRAMLAFEPGLASIPDGADEVVATFELIYEDGSVVPVLRPDTAGTALASGRSLARWSAGARYLTLPVPVGAATLRATFPADTRSNRVRMKALEQDVVVLRSGINDWVVR